MIRTFVVLGMHRSGTSLVSGGLQKIGIDIGKELLQANEWNPKGYFENVDFMKLNDKILHSASGTWYNPPSRDKILEQKNKFEQEIKDTISKHESDMWGWKDPRTTLTIDLYLPYLKNPFFIPCFREPLEVAESLKRRDGTDINTGLSITEIYNERLLEFLKEYVTI